MRLHVDITWILDEDDTMTFLLSITPVARNRYYVGTCNHYTRECICILLTQVEQ